MKALKLLLILLVITISSCEKEVPKQNILSIDDEISISSEVISLEEEIRGLNNTLLLLPKLDSSSIDEKSNLKAVQLDIKSFTSSDREEVNLKEEVGNLFDPSNFQCPLPKKVVKKIQKLRKKGKFWAPTEIANYIRAFEKNKVYLLPRTNITVLAHTIKIESSGNTAYWPLGAAFSYKNLEFERFVAKSSFDYFVYTLDCSGYLNAAINGTASVPGADITGKAESALTTQKSVFLSGGVIVPPIAPALYGNILGIQLTKEERINILEAILTYPEIKDNDMISIPNAYEIVWASNTGSSSFNGEASFEGSAGANLGVARISASASAGGNMTRTSKYTSNNTYLIDREPLDQFKPLSVTKIKELLDDLKKEN